MPKRKHYSKKHREWLNDKWGNAFLTWEVNYSQDNESWDGTLQIGDCYRSVSLDLGGYLAKDKKRVFKKLNRLIQTCVVIQAYIESLPVPEKRRPRPKRKKKGKPHV